MFILGKLKHYYILLIHFKKQNLPRLGGLIIILVGEEGLEPSLPCENQILSLARLPIPPLARGIALKCMHLVLSICDCVDRRPYVYSLFAFHAAATRR